MKLGGRDRAGIAAPAAASSVAAAFMVALVGASAVGFGGACARAPLSTLTEPGADGGVRAACEAPVNLVQPIPPDGLLVLD